MLAKETTKLTFLEPLLQWGNASFFFFPRGNAACLLSPYTQLCYSPALRLCRAHHHSTIVTWGK